MKISNRVKWYFVVAVALLFGVFVVLTDMCCDDGEGAMFAIRRANLRSVQTLLKDHATDHDGVFSQPNDFVEIFQFYGYTWPEPIMGENQDDAWMLPIPWEDAKKPQDKSLTQLTEFKQLPMLHERVSIDPEGTFVLFWDGSVRLLNNEEFAALINVEDSVCLGCQFPILDLPDGQGP